MALGLLLLPYAEIFACGCNFPAFALLRNELLRHVSARSQLDNKLFSNMCNVNVSLSQLDGQAAAAINAIPLSAVRA